MRDLFLLDPSVVFLNHGSFGACPRDVLDACHGWQREMERNPVEFLARRSSDLLRQAREALGRFVGTPADDLVFVPNATTAVNIVARSLALRPGDEVLATDLEYGACDATWQRVCAAQGAHYRRWPVALPFDRDAFVAGLLGAVTPRTRLVFLSQVASTTALVLPVAAVCAALRERGVPTLVDGAHAPGQLPLDLSAIGADFYAGNCHKWLGAPKGAGFLAVRPERQDGVDATVTSWGYADGVDGHAGFDAYLGRRPLERRLQWQGTRDIAAWLAVPAAIEFQRRHDWPRVQARCHAMALALLHRHAARSGRMPIGTDDDFAQMVPLELPQVDGAALALHLFDRHRIEVPVTRHGARQFARVSVQGYNSEADLAALESALEECADDPSP